MASEWLLPRVGSKTLTEVTRADIVDAINAMQATESGITGRPYAPRTVLHCYSTIRLLFDDALMAGAISSTPCTLRTKRGELPKKRDADPRWRSRSIYTRTEAETLISSETNPARPPHLLRVATAGWAPLRRNRRAALERPRQRGGALRGACWSGIRS